MALKLFFAPFLLLLCLQMDTAVSVRIVITPTTFSKGSGGSTTVDVTCRLDSGESDARELMLLRIARKGERAIVLLHQNNSISYSAGNAQEFPATGEVKKNSITSSSLQMTITTPDPEDSGAYSCGVFYIDGFGSLKEHTDSDYLTVEEPNVKLLNETVKKLQATVDQGKNDIDDLKKNGAESKTKLRALEEKLDDQEKDIRDLVGKDFDVDQKLKEMEENTKEQIKKIADTNTKTADRTKLIELENTVLHQAETIRDLTHKLSEFDKKMNALTGSMKKTGTQTVGDDLKDDVLNLKEAVELHTKSINDLGDEVKKNEGNNEKLKGVANVMAGKIAENERKVTNLESSLSDLKDETNKQIQNLESQKEDDLGNSFLNLQDTVKEHTKNIKEATDDAKEATEMAKKLKDVTEVLAKQIDAVKKKDDSKPSQDHVAFHVTSGVYSMYAVEKQALVFNEMTLNQGLAYDLQTGVFTAPKAGIYAFMLYLQVPCYECKMEVTIVANNIILARFTGGSRYDRDQHSISAVAKLGYHDKVKAVVTYVNKDKNKKSWSLGYMRKCAFSGFLVA